MIELIHVVKRFGELVAVNDFSLTVHKGEFFALLGPNAAGKTTTIKILSGLMKPNSGTVCVCGFDVQQQPLEMLLPSRLHTLHVAHREHYFAMPRTRSMGAGLQLFGRHQDGTEFPVDISLRPVLRGELLRREAAMLHGHEDLQGSGLRAAKLHLLQDLL